MARAEPQAAIVRGRPVGDLDARRRDVAEATLSVIAQSGLDGATLRAIAREASCTTGVLSHYFANKDDVLAFALESIFDALDDDIDRRARRQAGLTGLDALRADRAVGSADRRRVPIAGLRVAELCLEGRAQQTASRRSSAGVTARCAIASRPWSSVGQEDGSIRTDIAAEDLGDVVNACVDGFARMAPLEAGAPAPDRLLQLIDIQLQLIAA